jgi:hypothetical protein
LHQRSSLGSAGLMRLRGGAAAAKSSEPISAQAILSKVSDFVAFLVTPKAIVAIASLGDGHFRRKHFSLQWITLVPSQPLVPFLLACERSRLQHSHPLARVLRPLFSARLRPALHHHQPPFDGVRACSRDQGVHQAPEEGRGSRDPQAGETHHHHHHHATALSPTFVLPPTSPRESQAGTRNSLPPACHKARRPLLRLTCF